MKLYDYRRIFIFLSLVFFLGIPFELSNIVAKPSTLQWIAIIFFTLFVAFLIKKEGNWPSKIDRGRLIWALVLIVPIFSYFQHISYAPIVSSLSICLLLSLLISAFCAYSTCDFLLFAFLLFMPFAFCELKGTFLPLYLKILLAILFYIYSFYIGEIKRLKLFVKYTKYILYLYLVTLSLFSFHSFIFDRGREKEQKFVLFDTSHESIEDPKEDYTIDLKSKDFGHGKLVKFLQSLGYKTGFTSGHGMNLNDVSIFVAVMNSKPYTDSEIEKIVNFVKNGGGILIIGDHSDINNNMRSFNGLLRRFSLELNFDTIWTRGESRKEIIYLHHPLSFDISTISFSVGASIKANLSAKPFLISSYDTYSDLGDYSKDGFLGNNKLDMGEKVGNIILGTTSTYKKGRIVLLSDSSYFQNFSLYRNYDFGFRIFDWLNRENNFTMGRENLSLSLFFTIFILFLLAATFYLIQSKKKRVKIIFLTILIVMISYFISNRINALNYKRGNYSKLTPRVLVDLAHGNEYMSYWQTRENRENGIDSLFKQLLRNDFYPFQFENSRLTSSILSKYEIFISVCPNISFTDGERKALYDYVSNGGRVIIVDGERSFRPIDNFLQEYRVKFGDKSIMFEKPTFEDGFISKIPAGNIEAGLNLDIFINRGELSKKSSLPQKIKLNNPVEVSGIDFSISKVLGRDVIGIKKVGRGIILVIGDDQFFSNFTTEKEGEIVNGENLLFIWEIFNLVRDYRN